MKRLKLFSIKTLLLLICFNQYVQCSEILGDFFFKNHLFFEAITEYKREIFLLSGEQNNRLNRKIAMCYYHGNWNKQCRSYLENALTDDNILKEEEKKIYFQLAGLACKEQKPEMIRFELSFLEKLNDKNVQLLYGLSYFQEKNWLMWDQYYQKIEKDDFFRGYGKRLNQLKEKEFLLNLKTPNKASLLSAIIPGLGQIYNQSYLDGIASFALNGSIVFFMADQGRRFFQADKTNKKIYFALNFTLIYYFIFSRYYNGGIYNAYQGAVNFNEKLLSPIEKEKEKIYQELIDHYFE